MPPEASAGVNGSSCALSQSSPMRAGEEELRSFLRAESAVSCCGRLSCADAGGVAAVDLAVSARSTVAAPPLGVSCAACVPSSAGRGLSQAAVCGLRFGTGCPATPRRTAGVVFVNAGPPPVDSTVVLVGWPSMRAERLSLGVVFATLAPP